MKGFSLKSFIAGIIFSTIGISSVFALGDIKSAHFNDSKIIFNDNEIELSVTPMISVIKEGESNVSNYMPVRTVIEAMGYDVDWDESKNSIIISGKQIIFDKTTENTNVDIINPNEELVNPNDYISIDKLMIEIIPSDTSNIYIRWNGSPSFRFNDEPTYYRLLDKTEHKTVLDIPDSEIKRLIPNDNYYLGYDDGVANYFRDCISVEYFNSIIKPLIEQYNQ